jgi:ATP-dependent Lon protease
MTGFGNARLAQRGTIQPEDLPKAGSGKTKIGFVN